MEEKESKISFVIIKIRIFRSIDTIQEEADVG